MTRSVFMENWTSVLAAVGVKDKVTRKVLEIWWDGKAADQVVRF